MQFIITTLDARHISVEVKPTTTVKEFYNALHTLFKGAEIAVAFTADGERTFLQYSDALVMSAFEEVGFDITKHKANLQTQLNANMELNRKFTIYLQTPKDLAVTAEDAKDRYPRLANIHASSKRRDKNHNKLESAMMPVRKHNLMFASSKKREAEEALAERTDVFKRPFSK